MHQGMNVRPIASDLLFDEILVQRDSRVPFNADQGFISAPIEDNGVDNPAVREDRVSKFFEARTAVSLVIACCTEGQIDLLRCWCLRVHLQEFPYSRIRAIEFDRFNWDELQNA